MQITPGATIVSTRSVLWLCLTLLCCTAAANAATLGDYNVVWDSPSKDHHGSMPLGNGDIALNAWFTADGDLSFYIAKTDAWDDNARLVKVGKVRLRFEPNPIEPGSPFRQELDLATGALEITAGFGGTRIRLWVDANNPVIHAEVESRTRLEVTANAELWRTNRQELKTLEISDVMTNPKAPGNMQGPTFIEPDTIVTGRRDAVGWFHHNVKSVGPELMARIQGLTGFQQQDPLLYRTFGAMIKAERGVCLDELRLRSVGTSHRFSIFVLTRHPAQPADWLREMDSTILRVEQQPFTARKAAHVLWWRQFWDRSWIRATANPRAKAVARSIVPTNQHPVRLGMDQSGQNVFKGDLGRVSIWSAALSQSDIAALAKQDRAQPLAAARGLLFSGAYLNPSVISNSATWDFAAGLTVEAWVRPGKLPGSGARLVDKITPGGPDGFLFDTFPGNSLRLICGDAQLIQADVLPPDLWSHVAAVADPVRGGCSIYLNGTALSTTAGALVRDEGAWISQMYHLQRFITACAGRGSFPIKFNGSLFTVPPGATEKDPDYRRWGPGYWWQNTRLPYISLCTSGDFDLLAPFFRMYAEELLPLCQYRTRLYMGHRGAYYPECIMFWGSVFSETYGWTPFEERKDKLQESGWHKWEWVGGLELCWMMLDYYDHTQDTTFLNEKAIPFCRENLTFFDEHYPVNKAGELVMHPSQSLETWWQCTNAIPELAGCLAVSDRLLALPGNLGSGADRELWSRLKAKLPAIPLREVNGRKALAPAEAFSDKRNIENPELYPVFPFRLFAFNKPDASWAKMALENRWDRGHSGWRQDEIFMAYLGLMEDARKGVLSRARTHDAAERFPAFWGPNYDWTPDQDHGGVLMKAFQSMLLQTDGDKVFLVPAWPKDWDVDFKLRAPQQTTVEGSFRDGKLQRLRVLPESRRAAVQICQ